MSNPSKDQQDKHQISEVENDEAIETSLKESEDEGSVTFNLGCYLIRTQDRALQVGLASALNSRRIFPLLGGVFMKRSRYVVKAPSHDKNSTIYYNLRNGVGFKVANELISSFNELAEHPALHRVMSKHNFFHNPNEGQEVADKYRQHQEMFPFHLIILPHQNCNFRCVYCYE